MFLISRFNSVSPGVIIVMRLRVFLVVVKVRMQFRVVVVVDVKERSIDKPRHNTENAVDCDGDAHGQYSTPNYRLFDQLKESQKSGLPRSSPNPRRNR